MFVGKKRVGGEGEMVSLYFMRCVCFLVSVLRRWAEVVRGALW